MIVTAWNPETTELEKTYLTAVAQSASNTFKVKNADRMPQDSILLFGEMGMEQSELLIANTGGTDVQLVTTGNSKFPHTADEPVYKMRYNQVLFYRSDTVDGVYGLIATEPIDVDNRNKITEYQDLDGTGSSFYRTKYRNSITFEETEFSDTISAEGYGAKTIGSVIETVAKRVKDPNYSVLSSEDYLNIATEVNNDILSQSERPYNFMRQAVLLDRMADQAYVDLPEDYYKFYHFEYTNVVGGYNRTKRLLPISISNFDTGYGISSKSDLISRIAIDEDDNKILLSPTPRTTAAGAFKLWYYAMLGEFTDMSQEVKTPNTLIYEYKMRAEYYSTKSETDPSFGALSTKYEQKYGNELMKLQRSNRKDVGTPRSFMDSARQTSSTYIEGKRYHL